MGKVNKKDEQSNQPLPVDQNKLSEESKKSAFLPEFYRKLTVQCVGCGRISNFSPQQQKRWYEIWKMYIFATRDRCDDCQKEWRRLKNEISTYTSRLNNDCNQDELVEMRDSMLRFKVLQSSRFDVALFNRISNAIGYDIT